MTEAGASPREQSAAPGVVRVLCVEDLNAVAEAICEEIDRAEGMQSVGILASPERLLREVRRVKPDVVLLDLYYGGRDAFRELAALLKAEPDTPVIIVSGDNHPKTVERAMQGGARGYVVKSEMREVIAAIRAVAAGGTWRPGDLNAQDGDGGAEAIIDSLIAALGDPAPVENGVWAWQLGRLRVEAREEGEAVVIDLPWPLRSVAEAPSFGELHEEPGGEVKLRFVVGAAPALELVLAVIAYERREG